VEEWSVDQRDIHIPVGQTFKTKACNKKGERRKREGVEEKKRRREEEK